MNEDPFDHLNERITRLRSMLSELRPETVIEDVATDGEDTQIVIAARLRDDFDRRSKIYDKGKKFCDEFLKVAIGMGRTREIGPVRVKHYTKNQFDSTAWNTWVNSPNSGLKVHFDTLAEAKEAAKEEYSYLNNLISVTIKEENHE